MKRFNGKTVDVTRGTPTVEAFVGEDANGNISGILNKTPKMLGRLNTGGERHSS